MECPTLQDISLTGPCRDVKLTSEKFHIGRGLMNSFVISNIGISRTHCIIERNKGAWVIIDKSSNGTRVNGEMIEKNIKHNLKPGDVISLGDAVTYIFKLPERSSSTITKPISEDEILDAAASVLENADAFKEDCFTLSNTERAGTSAECTESAKSKIVDNSSPSTASAPKREHSSDNADDSESKKIKLEDDTHEDLQCSICTEMFVKAQTLACSHTFCKYCIEQWKNKQNFCPICRTKIKTLSSTLVIDSLIEKIIENSSKEIQDQRRAVIEERNAVPSASGSNTVNINVETNSNSETIILSDEESEDNSPYWEYSSDGDYEDDDYENESGAYYGGYGRCYICNRRGHWANGCPVRRH